MRERSLFLTEEQHCESVTLQASRNLKRNTGIDLHSAAADGSGADRARALRSARSRQIHRIVEVNIRSIEIGMVRYIGSVCTEL